MNVVVRRVAGADAVLLLASVVVFVSVVVAALASPSGDLQGRVRSIEAQLRCPTCQGLSIADSPATSAAQMRALVREQLAGGASDDEVRAFFVARYGRWILLDPPFGGPDIALWLAPVAILAIGGTLVVHRARARQPAKLPRRWMAIPIPPASRLSTVLIGGAMALALAVPIVAAVGPRLGGREISGGAVPQAAASIDELEAFVRAEPGDVEALVALGDALFAASRTSEAADRYRAALAIDPASTPALLGVGTILLGVDRPDAAGPVFDRVLALSPNQPDALLYRAIARLRLEGSPTSEVRQDVERFLEVASPNDPRRAMAAGLIEGSTGSAPASDVPASSPGSP